MYINKENSAGRPDGRYSKVIENIARDGVCPFCLENIKKYHPNPLIDKKFWLLTDNAYPYKPSKNHRLLVSKRHITHIKELTAEEWSELHEIIQEEVNAGKFEGGVFLCRFGDTRYTGASVTHLHAQIVQSDPTDPSYDKTKGLVIRIG